VVNNTIPMCKCFNGYSGDDCEISNTKIIFDIRIKRKHSNPLLEPGVEIVHRLNERSKYVTAEIKFA
jgi:hypothetical protein